MIVEAATARGELWLRDMRGELTGVRPGTNDVLLAPFRVSGLLRSSTGEVWALAYEDGNGVVWQRERGGWRELFSAPIRGTALRGLVELDGPGIVTRRLLLTPQRTVAFGEDVPSRVVTLSLAISGNSLWVGRNAGEWEGGLRRYSLETGEMVRVPLDKARQDVVQTVTAVVRDRPGCVLASLGLSHFLQDGLVVRACANGRLEVAADWDVDAKNEFSKHAAVFSLYATKTSTFASTFAGLRTVDDPEEPPEPWRFREVCGLHVSRPTIF